MSEQYTVAAFYKFADLPEFPTYQAGLAEMCRSKGVRGTILLAREGVNGTIAGRREGIDAVLTALRALPGCADLEHKESFAPENPFYRLKVRLKREIVTMGVPDIDPACHAGTYIDPAAWNAVLDDPDTVVIDTRNDYEVAIGSFDGAINPHTASFRDFPSWFEAFRRTNTKSRVAMFCTGGIRCEKSTAFARSVGEAEVVHLKGGILKYLETVPEAESRWLGECFVFDQRVSVGHGLKPGTFDQCYACRRPITEEDKASPYYEPGVSCPFCHGQTTQDQRARFAERQRQLRFAAERGEPHLGDEQAKRFEALRRLKESEAP